MLLYKHIYCIAFLLIQITCSNANENTLTLTDSSSRIINDTILEIDDVLVVASRIDAKLRSVPGAVQLITPENLEKKQMASLPEIVNTVPGVYMQSGSYQTSRLTIRGIGSRSPYATNRVRAFYNDIPLTMADGTTLIDDIDPLFIGQAEIVKGPNASLYGSGLGGAIRLNSVQALKNETVTLVSGTASFGQYKLGALAGKWGRSASFTVGLVHNSAAGFRENSEFDRNALLISGFVGRSFKVHYLFHVAKVKAHIPSSIDLNTFENTPQKAAQNWLNVKGYKSYLRLLGAVRFENTFKKNGSNNLIFTINTSNPYEVRPFNILDDNSTSHSVHDNLKLVFGRFTFRAGAELQYETYYWQILQNSTLEQLKKASERRLQANAYTAIQWMVFDKTLLSISINYNTSSYEVKDLHTADSVNYSGKTKRNESVSPRAGVNFPIASALNFYTSAGHGFSNPTVEESLNSEGYLDRTLKPEQGWGIDAGIRGYVLGKSLWIDAGVYRIWLNNLLITRRISEEIFSGLNAGSAVMSGFELMAKYTPWQTLRLQSSLQASSNKFDDFIGEVDYSNNYLPGIPNIYLNSSIETDITQNLTTDFIVNYCGNQYITDDNTIVAPQWLTIDFSTKYNAYFHNVKIEITAGAKNIFDQRYASMLLINAPAFGNNAPRYYYPGMPRNYYFMLKIGF